MGSLDQWEPDSCRSAKVPPGARLWARDEVVQRTRGPNLAPTTSAWAGRRPLIELAARLIQLEMAEADVAQLGNVDEPGDGFGTAACIPSAAGVEKQGWSLPESG